MLLRDQYGPQRILCCYLGLFIFSVIAKRQCWALYVRTAVREPLYYVIDISYVLSNMCEYFQLVKRKQSYNPLVFFTSCDSTWSIPRRIILEKLFGLLFKVLQKYSLRKNMLTQLWLQLENKINSIFKLNLSKLL